MKIIKLLLKVCGFETLIQIRNEKDNSVNHGAA